MKKRNLVFVASVFFTFAGMSLATKPTVVETANGIAPMATPGPLGKKPKRVATPGTAAATVTETAETSTSAPSATSTTARTNRSTAGMKSR